MSLTGQLGSNILMKGVGASHPGVGPQDISTAMTISTGSPLSTPVNGMQLFINNTTSAWSNYINLPAYLTGAGKLTTTVINETDSGTFTLNRGCRAYMLRNPAWNAVDTTGWTVVESAKAYQSVDSNQTVYYRDFIPGTYAMDNNSAMYIFDFNYLGGVSGAGISGVSAPAGNIGQMYVSSASAATALTNQRYAQDPFFAGNVTYSVVSGSLPPGLSLNATTGVISGTYTVQGINTNGTAYSFTIRATAANNIDYTDRSYTVSLVVPFLYRQIITRNYMAGGYQGGSLWSNVNRTLHSNETSTNLGDGTIDNYHYKSGAYGDTYGWIWNGASTSRFNMRTEVKANATGAPPYSCANTGTALNSLRTTSYTAGEGSTTPFKFTYSTETFANLSATVSNDHMSTIYGEFIGCFWTNANTQATSGRINFSTEAWSTATAAHSVHGQQKGFNGKVGYGYGSTGGSYNGGTALNKVNLTTATDSNVSTTITKPCQNQGEDNNGTGQAAIYTIGGYDGVGNGQNNRSGRLNVSTDAAAEINGSLQPGGHVGASSGHCFARD